MFRKVVLSGVSLASVPAIVSTVHAAEETPDQAVKSTGKKLIRAKDLSLYDEPVAPRVEFAPDDTTALEGYLSVARKGVWNFMDSIEETTTWCKDKYDISKAHTNDLLVYLREDQGALPRAVFITVSGLGGIVAGYKGGVFRKFVFAGVGMTTAAAICYPNQAVDISRQAWQKVPMPDLGFQTKSRHETPISKEIGEGANKNLDKLKEVEPDKKSTEGAEKTKENKETKSTDVKDSKKASSEATEKMKDGKEANEKNGDPKTPVKKDHGMSKEEDKDLYTTRGK